ncbi:MAG: ABC transporter ATP-binding protein [Patescibacteria group bacterium]|nr:ABC transporter ATP-binding protein [Patescibacteria group bacterium]MDE1940723.1 ABC transporter ATP-binding protein [Patescibacteria group bacterium]MDE1966677.1 ABC transporter ATP-binding protein [Patescibacteria group bacterium]
MASIISVQNLVKKFGRNSKEVTAVDGISFDIAEGTITGLLGPNGAGKTTTIQMILDLITPTSGKIEVFGLDMKRHREEILHKVNFSSPYVSLPSNLKVWENLYTFGRLYGVRDVRAKVDELADFFAIRDLLPRMTSSLSTGQLTRLNLTKALLNDPKLLLLDEPTASLDPDIADRTRKLLVKIKEERGITMLYTSHNMEEIEEICDRVIFINKGKIRDDGTPKELVAKHGRKDLNEVFLAIARESI